MSADTRLFDKPAPLTREQARAAAEGMIAASFARPRRFPRRFRSYPPEPADNTPAGDLRAADESLGDVCDRDRAEVLPPGVYGQVFW